MSHATTTSTCQDHPVHHRDEDWGLEMHISGPWCFFFPGRYGKITQYTTTTRKGARDVHLEPLVFFSSFFPSCHVMITRYTTTTRNGARDTSWALNVSFFFFVAFFFIVLTFDRLQLRETTTNPTSPNTTSRCGARDASRALGCLYLVCHVTHHPTTNV